MSLSLRAKVEMLSLLRGPAVLWSLVALVSVPQQAATSVVSTMVRGGQHLPEGKDHSRGAWLGCRVGRGPPPVGRAGLAEVPSLSPVLVPLPSRWCNWTANPTAALPLFPPPCQFPQTLASLSSTFFLDNCGWKAWGAPATPFAKGMQLSQGALGRKSLRGLVTDAPGRSSQWWQSHGGPGRDQRWGQSGGQAAKMEALVLHRAGQDAAPSVLSTGSPATLLQVGFTPGAG